MNINIEDKAQLEKWKQNAEKSSFFGIKLEGLDRDALLSVIGCLSEESKDKELNHKQDIDFFRMCSKAYRTH